MIQWNNKWEVNFTVINGSLTGSIEGVEFDLNENEIIIGPWVLRFDGPNVSISLQDPLEDITYIQTRTKEDEIQLTWEWMVIRIYPKEGKIIIQDDDDRTILFIRYKNGEEG